MEELTGVTGLIPDPTHYWAGLHVNPPGAFQAIHRDFRVHPITGLFHRVNILIYLNSDWKSEYRGELELWKSDKSACERQVAPLAGKSVIFEAGPLAFHGYPNQSTARPEGLAFHSPPSTTRWIPLRTIVRSHVSFAQSVLRDPWYMGFGTFGDGVNLVKRMIERRSAIKDQSAT